MPAPCRDMADEARPRYGMPSGGAAEARPRRGQAVIGAWIENSHRVLVRRRVGVTHRELTTAEPRHAMTRNDAVGEIKMQHPQLAPVTQDGRRGVWRGGAITNNVAADSAWRAHADTLAYSRSSAWLWRSAWPARGWTRVWPRAALAADFAQQGRATGGRRCAGGASVRSGIQRDQPVSIRWDAEQRAR
jgi:hypothetical protein